MLFYILQAKIDLIMGFKNQHKITISLQLVGDVTIFYVSLWISVFLRLLRPVSFTTYVDLSLPYLAIFILWLVVFMIIGLYERSVITNTHEIATNVIRAQLINGVIAIIFFYFLNTTDQTSRSVLLLELITSTFFLILWRTVLHLRSKRQNKYPTIIFSDEDVPKELESALSSKEANHPFKLLFRIGKKDIKNNANLLNKIRENKVKFIIVDINDVGFQKDYSLINDLISEGVKIYDMRDVYEALFQCVPHSLFNYHWYINRINPHEKFAYQIMKRFTDFFTALIGIIVSLPFYPLIALAIKLEDSGPVFIKQTRIGKNIKEFTSYKFRTMRRNEDGVWLAESDNQVTKVGKLLRRTRLDELPQLFSVLVGRMSLIGPRPDMAGLEKRLSKEIAYYRLRSLIKPGLSGWAVIKQAYIPQSVEETKYRLGYDLYYIKNQSTALDLKILLQTIKAVIGGIWHKSRL